MLFGGVSHAQDQKTKLIRSVEIVRQDVFPEITGRPRFLYQWANTLHIVTRENVIRRVLLFKPGDEFDPELLAESERKLRQLAYIGEANIFITREEEQAVDIAVVTQDQWSTLVSLILSQGGGRTTFGAGVEEFNLFGFGKQIFSEISHESREGTTLTLRYRDPQLFGSRWTTEEAFVTGPFIDQISAQLIRPFYALDTRWAGGVAASKTDETIRLFSGGDEISRLGLETASVQILGARALGKRFTKIRLQLTYRFLRRDFSALGDLTTTPLPADELIHGLTATLTFENLNFAKEKQLDNFVRTEDLTLGRTTSLSFGRTGLPVPEGVKRFELSGRRREAHQLATNQYLILILAAQTLFEKDTIASLRLQYYHKWLRSQTLACNLEFDYGHDLEASRQFLLGGDSGLRGYRAREFAGDKLFLFNLENRLFTPLTILTVALGGVLFFDAGNVWGNGEAIDLADLHYSLGAGLRLGYTKSPSSRVGRIDFAWPINRGGFEVSIGVGQQFTLN